MWCLAGRPRRSAPAGRRLRSLAVALRCILCPAAVIRPASCRDSRSTASVRTCTDDENRLRALERFRFTLLGAAVAVPAVASAAGTLDRFALTHR
jgi:hypothetical protein